MNPASVDEPATVGWNFDLYAIVPPASWITVLPKESHVFMQLAQSESAYAWTM